MKIRPQTHRAAVLQVLAVLASICFVTFALVAFAVYRTVTVGSDLRSARNAVLRDAHLRFTHRIEATARPWLVSAARFGLGFAPLDPDARLAIQSIRGAEVGVYELTARPNEPDRRDLFKSLNVRMEERGWTRTVAVYDRDDMVMVYTPAKELSASKVEAFVIVLNDRQLVMVSGKGNLEPIVDLVNRKMEHHHLPGPLFASWRE